MRKYFFIPVFIVFIVVVALVLGYMKARSDMGGTPYWKGQKQEALTIPQGGYVTLQADGMDPFSLDRAVLSTNETGTWNNETAQALLWMQDAVYGFDNFGTATYEDGVLYAPSKGNNNVYAINAASGSIIWNRTVRQCDGSPCVDGEVVYVGECSGPNGEPTPFPRAMALNRTNGEVIWYFIEPSNSTWVGSPLVVDDYVYYTTYGSGVYALNKTDGSTIWHNSIGLIVCSVAYDNGVVFVSVYDPPGQYAFNATTGAQMWHQNYGQSWDTSPVVYEGLVVQVAFDNIDRVWTTCVLNETNGERVRTFIDKGSTATPLVHDGKVFIPSNDWRMYTFNLSNGEELWRTGLLHNGALQNLMYCSPAASGGAIYCQSLNGTFYAINETDGNVLWSYGLSSYGFGSPSIGDGCVFITNDGALYAFRIGPGSGDWPMFCHNNFHRSLSEQGVQYVRWPMTQPQYLGEISNTWVTAKFTWCNETINSAAIAWRIYFFDSAGNANVTDVKIFYVNMSIHNVALVNIVPKETLIMQNQTTSINVTAANQGNYTETFNLTLYYGSSEVGVQTVTLNAGEVRILTFQWNTAGVPTTDYTLSASASSSSGEIDTQDNNYALTEQIAVIPEFPLTLTLIAALAGCALAVVTAKRKAVRQRK